jgi:hypothetical protein
MYMSAVGIVEVLCLSLLSLVMILHSTLIIHGDTLVDYVHYCFRYT